MFSLGRSVDEITAGLPELPPPSKAPGAKTGEFYSLTLGALYEMLRYIDPSDPERTPWIAIGGALHWAAARDLVTLADMVTPDASFDGLTVFTDWSAGKYWAGEKPPELWKADGSPTAYKGADVCEKDWNSFDAGKTGAAKPATIIARARADGYPGDGRRTAAEIFAPYTVLDLSQDDAPPKGEQSNSSFEIINAEGVVPKPVDWMWLGRLAFGKMTVLSGAPGQGKSHGSLYIAAKISRGDSWIDGGFATKGRVLILSSEDGINDTMVPRLIALGADLSKIHFIRATIDPTGKRRAFSLQADLDKLGELVKSYGDIALIVIDPITSYMGDRTDTHQTSQVRAVLDPVSDFAERHNIAILGISHPPKNSSTALNSVTGSLAFVAAARLVLCAIEDASWPGQSLLLVVKPGPGPKAAGLRYSIEGCEIEGRGGKIKTSRLTWNMISPVTMTADEAMTAVREAKRGPSKVDQAKEFLREKLQGGAVPQKDIEMAAEKEGLSWSTIKRAKAELGIVSEKDGLGGWVWELSHVSPKASEGVEKGDEQCF